jgi:hypothetical protein
LLSLIEPLQYSGQPLFLGVFFQFGLAGIGYLFKRGVVRCYLFQQHAPLFLQFLDKDRSSCGFIANSFEGNFRRYAARE